MGSLEWFKDVGPLIEKTGEAPPMECMQVSRGNLFACFVSFCLLPSMIIYLSIGLACLSG